MLESVIYDHHLPVKVEVMKIKNYPWHMHDNDIQIVYVLEGEVELKLAYARYRLVKNNIHFVHNDDVHGFRGITDENLVIILSLKIDFFSQYYPDLGTQLFSSQVSEDIATYKKQLIIKAHIFSIISELHNHEFGYEQRIAQISLNLMDVMYQEFRSFVVDLDTKTIQHQIPHDRLQIERISRVISFIYTNYPYKISLAAIAEKENLNQYYLSHLFQKLVGDSFRNFVSMARVEMSESELLSTDNSITQIANHVGFSNLKYYVDNFKTWFGCHPKQYRELYKDQILGIAKTDIEQRSLSSINMIIEGPKQKPAYTEVTDETKSIVFDYKKYGGKIQSQKDKTFYHSLYDNSTPQEDAVKALKDFIQTLDKNTLIDRIRFVDRQTDIHGMYAVNGMKKPLFYIMEFIFSLEGELRRTSEWCVSASGNHRLQFLFCNDSTSNTQNFEFHLLKMPGEWQVSKKCISAGNSCIDAWKKINYKTPLNEEEKYYLLQTSSPEISLYTESSSGNFTVSTQLKPQDLCLIEIKKQTIS